MDKHGCEYEAGCERAAEEWTLPTGGTIHLCEDHALDFGFCVCCGAFISETEGAVLTGIRGICDMCDMDIAVDEEFFEA